MEEIQRKGMWEVVWASKLSQAHQFPSTSVLLEPRTSVNLVSLGFLRRLHHVGMIITNTLRSPSEVTSLE